MKFNEYLKLIGYVLITFVIVWVLALISNKYFDVEINSDTAIISFIGIIATFIVLGNYSQVAEMRNQALDQTEKFNLKIQEFDVKLKEIDSLKEMLEAKETDVEKLKKELYDGQIESYLFLSVQFKRSNDISFILLKSAFILLPKGTYKKVNDVIIKTLTASIKNVDKRIYMKIFSKQISNAISRLKDEKKTDEKLLKELQEEVDKKNIEFGY